MKKSIRMIITGNLQSLFFKEFIKQSAAEKKVFGFLRILEDARVEIFIEGDHVDVQAMVDVCSKGPKYAQIRNIEIKDERFQGFKDFKVFNF
jgi:acylphosphatase